MHGVGPFLLRHFRSMSETAEAEQARLARRPHRPGRGGLDGHRHRGDVRDARRTAARRCDGTLRRRQAVIAIRTGSASLDTLVLEVNSLHEEALFVGDLQRLYVEAAERAIPVGGEPLPDDPSEIRFENVMLPAPSAPDAAVGGSATSASCRSARSWRSSVRTARARRPW